MEATLIDDLIEKCDYTIQKRLTTDEKDPTDLLKLAKRCQRIKFAIKNFKQNKALYDRELARKNKRSVSWNKVIINSYGNTAAPAQVNSNLTTP